APDPDALALWALLRLRHSGRNASFAISPKAMEEAGTLPGWRRQRIRSAAQRLATSHGKLVLLHRGGRCPGDPNIYAFAEKGPANSPNLIGHPAPRPLSSSGTE